MNRRNIFTAAFFGLLAFFGIVKAKQEEPKKHTGLRKIWKEVKQGLRTSWKQVRLHDIRKGDTFLMEYEEQGALFMFHAARDAAYIENDSFKGWDVEANQF